MGSNTEICGWCRDTKTNHTSYEWEGCQAALDKERKK